MTIPITFIDHNLPISEIFNTLPILKIVKIIYFVNIFCLPIYFLIGMLPSPMLGFKVLLERIQVVFFGEPIVTFGAFYVNFIGLGG